ncbi:hypothetical protein [Amycolatopsis sp. DSM 110486]|uniref:hypothetical protein n=1 Tax=Amycolatopsis sp. DSM 110486 TaxID=2865832 RepID=UPI001C6A641B|nr:hypothetical protein [Amycolatopsis sp. DSM 110486]QYN17515.1 hypothetical protein K1T34_32535 [Amycolatopsis sp. DSM 110486]
MAAKHRNLSEFLHEEELLWLIYERLKDLHDGLADVDDNTLTLRNYDGNGHAFRITVKKLEDPR